MRTIGTIERKLSLIEESFILPEFPVSGFSFVLEGSKTAEAYNVSEIERKGFGGQPRHLPDGFIYVAEEYQNYLDVSIGS